MILLDTHIWIWWVHGDSNLTIKHSKAIQSHEPIGLGVSIISCWEVAKLVEYNRLQLPLPVEQWIATALDYPGVTLLSLSPEIAIESTQLPGQIHRDPADQIIAATARLHDISLVTQDRKLIKYKYVKTI